MTGEAGVDVHREGFVGRITINRPDRLNALAKSTFSKLIELALELDDDPDVRVIVFTGAGTRAFSAGVDLKELDQAGSMLHPMGGIQRNLNEVVMELSKPTIAAINGVAAGGGCELALACDLRIAADTARISLPEAKVGMGANFGSVVLPLLIPRCHALHMLYTGELIDMAVAERWGLVNRVVPNQDLLTVVSATAKTIAENAPLSVQRMKTVAFQAIGLPVSAGLRLSVEPNPYSSQDRLEGARAFVEKRKPCFKGN